MALRTKKIAVYYRDLPKIVEDTVATDRQCHLVKDGIFTANGVKCPRATITLEWEGSEGDKERLKKLERLLGELQSNNQIVSFSVR